MSGGSWDYSYWKVEEMASYLRVDRNNCHPLRVALAKHMLELAKVMKEVEWSDSGDTAEDAWIEPVKSFLDNSVSESLSANASLKEIWTHRVWINDNIEDGDMKTSLLQYSSFLENLAERVSRLESVQRPRLREQNA